MDKFVDKRLKIAIVISNCLAFAIFWYYVGGAILKNLSFATYLTLSTTINFTINIKLQKILLSRRHIGRNNKKLAIRHYCTFKSYFSFLSISILIGFIMAILLLIIQINIKPKSKLCNIGENCSGLIVAEIYYSNVSGEYEYDPVDPQNPEAQFVMSYLKSSRGDCSIRRREPVHFLSDADRTISVTNPKDGTHKEDILILEGQGFIGTSCFAEQSGKGFEIIHLEVRDENYWK